MAKANDSTRVTRSTRAPKGETAPVEPGASDSISRALNTLFDIRALASGVYGILECVPTEENAADVFRLARLIIDQAEAAIAQLNKVDAALLAKKGGAA